MDVRLFNDPREFVSLAGGFLAADPFSTTVIGVRVDGVLSGMHSVADDDVWAAVVADDDVVVGVAMRTPPHPLVLSRMPNAAAAELAVALAKIGRLLGVNGEIAAATAFAAAWADGSGSTVDASMRLYRLGALQVPDANGSARLAAPADAELVLDWLMAFHAEAAPNHPIEGLADVLGRRLAAGQLWFWVTDEPVSLAGLSAPANGVSRIGPVYTPPAFRRHGYGAAVTAHASQAALDAGADHVVLYTDLTNPTSNAIYQSLGYVPDHDFEERSFTLA